MTATALQDAPQTNGKAPPSDLDQFPAILPPDCQELDPCRNHAGAFRIGDPRITTDRPTTQLREARTMQRFIYAQAQEKGIKPVDLAALARAWSVLQESIRVLRGIPNPGQFRPELDPLKNAKKGKLRVLDLAPSEGPGDPTPDAGQVAKPKRGPFGRPLKTTTATAPPAAPDTRDTPPAQDMATEGATEQPTPAADEGKPKESLSPE